MKILCTISEFKVAVNATPMFEFKHRIKEVNQIDRINILHDVSLTSVTVDTLPWDTDTSGFNQPYCTGLQSNSQRTPHFTLLSPNTVQFNAEIMFQYSKYSLETEQAVHILKTLNALPVSTEHSPGYKMC